MITSLSIDRTGGDRMSSGAEVLAPRGRLGQPGPEARRWAALLVLAPSARPGHSAGGASVSECSGPSLTDTRGIITMTSIQESIRPLPLIGPSVGLAQAALARLLTGILAESG